MVSSLPVLHLVIYSPTLGFDQTTVPQSPPPLLVPVSTEVWWIRSFFETLLDVVKPVNEYVPERISMMGESHRDIGEGEDDGIWDTGFVALVTVDDWVRFVWLWEVMHGLLLEWKGLPLRGSQEGASAGVGDCNEW